MGDCNVASLLYITYKRKFDKIIKCVAIYKTMKESVSVEWGNTSSSNKITTFLIGEVVKTCNDTSSLEKSSKYFWQ